VLRDELTESLVVETIRRLSTGKRPAYNLHATLILQIHDGTDSWRAVSEHHWTGGCAIERAPAKLAYAVDGLYQGMTLPEKLGADWKIWLPAIRAALGGTGRFSFATVDDARLLRPGMAVIHPRWAVVGMPGDLEEVPCYAGPPVDLADLPALARRLREPVALLRAIRAAYAAPVRTWLRTNRRPSPPATPRPAGGAPDDPEAADRAAEDPEAWWAEHGDRQPLGYSNLLAGLVPTPAARRDLLAGSSNRPTTTPNTASRSPAPRTARSPSWSSAAWSGWCSPRTSTA
jgi:hypothetical protein